MSDDLVGIAEIAQRANKSPGFVRVLRHRHPDFPAPVADLAMGPVWNWPEIEAWLAQPRPTGRPARR